jgi:hypothetical protein
MRKLTFEPGCLGRSELERAGIPEPSIATIAPAFMQEQTGCRHSHFEKAFHRSSNPTIQRKPTRR